MSLRDVRDALAGAVKTTHPEWNVYPDIRGVKQVPAVVIRPTTDLEVPSAEYYIDFGGSTKWFIDVEILLPFTDMDSSQRSLDREVSPDEVNSVARTLDSRHNPGLIASGLNYVKMRKMTNYGGEYESAQIKHIGAVLKLEVEETCEGTE